jgi:hypothetical protein
VSGVPFASAWLEEAQLVAWCYAVWKRQERSRACGHGVDVELLLYRLVRKKRLLAWI